MVSGVVVGKTESGKLRFASQQKRHSETVGGTLSTFVFWDAPLGVRRFSGDKMNRTFQVVFNAARGLMTVTNEVTRHKTKTGAKAVVIGTAALLTGGGHCSRR